MIGTIGVGIVGVGIFVIVKLGLIKSWFILKTLPGLLSARMIYAAFPFGLSFLLAYLIASQPNYDGRTSNLMTFALLVGPVFGFWFMYRPPRWIKPNWLQWLEQEYGYCLPILIEEAQKMNRWTWEAKVRTRSGMQEWIDDVFIRRQKDVDFAWQDEKVYLLDRQTDKEKTYGIVPGMEIKGYVPIHRQHDTVLTQADIDAVIPVRKSRYRIADEYKSD